MTDKIKITKKAVDFVERSEQVKSFNAIKLDSSGHTIDFLDCLYLVIGDSEVSIDSDGKTLIISTCGSTFKIIKFIDKPNFVHEKPAIVIADGKVLLDYSFGIQEGKSKINQYGNLMAEPYICHVNLKKRHALGNCAENGIRYRFVKGIGGKVGDDLSISSLLTSPSSLQKI